MIYLDYSATTPVDERVLDSYCKVTREFIGNANSIHTLGVKSKELLMQATNQIAEILNCHPKELIFTSGASESNTTAIKGVAFKYCKRGKHIITSKLEHKSVLEVMGYLSNIGYENGKNLYTVNVDGHLFIFDCGMKYAPDKMYGVDYVIPDFSYLVEHEKEIVGIFISHPHRENMGALTDLLKA